MSEFGFQSFPEMRTIRTFSKPEDLDVRSTVMQSHQKNHGGNERILTHMLREYREPKDFASFAYLSQVQQAEASSSEPNTCDAAVHAPWDRFTGS